MKFELRTSLDQMVAGVRLFVHVLTYISLDFPQRCAIDDDFSYTKTTEGEITKEGSIKSTESDGANITYSDDLASKAPITTVQEQTKKVDSAKPPVFDMPRRLSCKWTTATGPRIGCVRDYPTELQSRALEQVNLSPRVGPGPSVRYGPIPSPRPSPKVRLSPRLAYMGLPSPRTPIAAGN